MEFLHTQIKSKSRTYFESLVERKNKAVKKLYKETRKKLITSYKVAHFKTLTIAETIIAPALTIIVETMPGK